MELTYSKGFTDITDSCEVYEINGGTPFGVAVIAVAVVVGGCAVVGFAAGCVYEYYLG